MRLSKFGVIGRGNLIYSDKDNSWKFIMDGNEEPTCSSCKIELNGKGYACKHCLQVYCYECIKDYKSCVCYKNKSEHIYYKCVVSKSGVSDGGRGGSDKGSEAGTA